jgi:hydrogenase maturation protein HypF
MALVFAFDGTGYGTDGAIWGGEVLLARYQGFERVAHLKYTPLPGGDSAIRHPARVALAHLFAAGIEWSDDLPCVQACTAVELRILRQQLTAGTHSARSSSMGRLFDAVAAFLGLRRTVSYEGQAAIELETRCARFKGTCEPYAVAFGETEFDVTPMWEEMTRDLRAGSDQVLMAARFHRTISEVIRHYSRRVRQEFGVTTIGMTGGVFQNVYLLNAAVEAAGREGLRVLTHGTVPPNDGGIALGQAVIGG